MNFSYFVPIQVISEAQPPPIFRQGVLDASPGCQPYDHMGMIGRQGRSHARCPRVPGACTKPRRTTAPKAFLAIVLSALLAVPRGMTLLWDREPQDCGRVGKASAIELNESSRKRRHALKRYKYTESLSSNQCVSFDQSVGPIALVWAHPPPHLLYAPTPS